MLSLSMAMTSGLSSLQRLYGTSQNVGVPSKLLQPGETALSNLSFSAIIGFNGNVTTASCEPMPQGDEPRPTREPKPQGETKPVIDAKPKGETKPTVDAKPKDETKPTVDAKPKGETKPAVDAKPRGETKPAVDTKPKGDTKPAADAKPRGETKPAADAKPRGETKPAADVKPQGDTKPAADAKPQGETKPAADAKPQGESKPAADAKPRVKTLSDDTIYGFNSNTGKPEMTLTSASDKPDFTVWDDRGVDTFDFSGFEQDQSIDLRGGSRSSVGGMKENIRIAENTVIENAIGGRGNDRIVGNSADNVMIGGAGADTLVGGGGWNTFKFNAFTDSTRTQADLLLDFNTGQDKIDLSQMAIDGKVAFNFVNAYTGQAGDTLIKFNPQSGRYLLAIDLDGDSKTDFLIKSTRMISPEDVIGLNVKDDGYL
ncbi:MULTISPECIES: M10 family metallopeptidase C-terminal domain-containing protein [unclassified Pseudomonas]|uniref:M10 family metallopeptidase C-terminal domain-containing protein n=1 Tax=unclassified Pseudomonas TaxID=196821 RepID=UPI00211408E8|nr:MULTISPECIES: M10 family metallopeptidase C-terminal domain-containing protein [unclassified Pseudomonas]